MSVPLYGILAQHKERIEFLRSAGASKIIVLGDEPRWRAVLSTAPTDHYSC
jgi:hypothetical protein